MTFSEAHTGNEKKRPVDIKYHRRSQYLELVYSDGQSFKLSSEYLRVFSPSAEVRGHGVGQEVLQHGKKDINILKMEPRGNYAIQLVFDDKHDSGIYDWGYLFDLGTNQESHWADYLERLHLAGKTRDPEVQAVRLGVGTFDPSKK